MADAGTHCTTSNLRSRISRAYEKRRGSLRSLRRLERHVLRGVHYPGGRRVCAVLRSIWANRKARSDHHPNCSEAGLLFPVALCFALSASAVARNTSIADRTGTGHCRSAASPLPLRRRRKELEATTDRGSDRVIDRNHTGDLHSSRAIYALESAHERVEQRSRAGWIHSSFDRACEAGGASLSSQAVPQLPFTWRKWRTTRARSRQRGSAAHTRSAHSAGNSRWRQHASVWKELKSSRDNGACRVP